VKRIDILYGGSTYSVGGRELADLQEEIGAAASSPSGAWVQVNDGEGMQRTAYLLVGPGTSIAVVPVPDVV
jgi:hypothetical protein